MRGVKRCLLLVMGVILLGGMGAIGLTSNAKAKGYHRPSHSHLKAVTVRDGRATRNTVRSENEKNIAEFSQQHNMIKDDLAAAQAAIQADLATLQAAVDALEPGVGGPACGPGTAVGRFVINGGDACDTTTGLVCQRFKNYTVS